MLKATALDFERRRAWSDAAGARARWQLAKRTDYGRSVRGGESSRSWPLLDKELLRHGLEVVHHRQASGCRRRPPPAAPAACRCKVVRSLEAIVFEQATIDRRDPVGRASIRARARTAVLRGDNPRDIDVSPNPDCEIINGGRIMTMSANAVTHTSVEHIANSLENVRAAVAVRLSERARDAVRATCATAGAGSRFRPCVTSSEVFRPDAWTLVEEMLGCRMVDYYGQAERIAFAYASAPREYRFLHGYSHVEFDSLRRSCDRRATASTGCTKSSARRSGTTCCRMVRYRTGDLVRLPADWGARELEELSLGLRTFRRRARAPAGSHASVRSSVRLTGIGSRAARRRATCCASRWCRKTFDSARIFVLPAREFSAADAEVLLANARATDSGGSERHASRSPAGWSARRAARRR